MHNYTKLVMYQNKIIINYFTANVALMISVLKKIVFCDFSHFDILKFICKMQSFARKCKFT